MKNYLLCLANVASSILIILSIMSIIAIFDKPKQLINDTDIHIFVLSCLFLTFSIAWIWYISAEKKEDNHESK